MINCIAAEKREEDVRGDEEIVKYMYIVNDIGEELIITISFSLTFWWNAYIYFVIFPNYFCTFSSLYTNS